MEIKEEAQKRGMEKDWVSAGVLHTGCKGCTGGDPAVGKGLAPSEKPISPLFPYLLLHFLSPPPSFSLLSTFHSHFSFILPFLYLLSPFFLFVPFLLHFSHLLIPSILFFLFNSSFLLFLPCSSLLFSFLPPLFLFSFFLPLVPLYLRKPGL